MTSKRINYQISFGIEKEAEMANKKIKEDIPSEDIKFEGNFDFFDYSSNSTIGNLKEYFLTTFGQKYAYCKCELYLYRQISRHFNSTKYQLITTSDNSYEQEKLDKIKLNKTGCEKLYLVKRNSECNCNFKLYHKYMNMQKFDIISKLKEMNDENINLKREIQKLKKQEEIENHDNSEVEKFYDIVIDINSIKKLNTDGWSVKFNQDGLSKYEEHKRQKEQKAIILGVLGNNNKGKSFLLSRISQIRLLTGTSIQTKGLSVKYPKLEGYSQRQIILLDSAGLETPVLKNLNVDQEKNKKENNEIEEIKINEEVNQIQAEDKIIEIEKEKENGKPDEKEVEQNKEFKESARDKIMTELFLQNFIIMTTDILLVVVGKLTYSEQLLINKIKVESKNNDKNRLFIIHNLQEFRTESQVQDYIKNTLLKCSTFDLKKRQWISAQKDIPTKKGKGIPSKKIEENKDIIHINQKDENKIQINPNQDELKIEINNPEEKKDIKDNKIQEKNIEEDSILVNIHFTEILHYEKNKKLEVYHLILANEDSPAGKIYNPYAYNFIEHLYNIIPEIKEFDIFEKVKDNFIKLANNFLKDDIKKDSFNKNEDIIKDHLIKLNLEKELTLKTCYTDELGFSFFKTGDFEPKYNYFKPDENTLEIRLETPGRTECAVTHDIIGDKTIVTVKGVKNKDNNPKKFSDNIYNIREFSEFELNIPLKAEQFKINSKTPKEGYPKYIHGICIIQYELAQKAEEIKVSPNVSDEL